MDWLRQVFIQSLIAATAAAGLVLLPWTASKVFCGVFLMWFLVSVGRNPLYFWRRLARLVVVAAIPPLVAGLTFRFSGQAMLPDDAGWISVVVEQAGGGALPLVAMVLGTALVFDGIIYWHQSRRRVELFVEEVDAAPLSVNSSKTATILCPLLIRAPDESASITGATIALLGLFPDKLISEVFIDWDGGAGTPVDHANPLRLTSNEEKALSVKAEARGTIAAWWLRTSTSPALAWLGLARGELRLTGLPKAVRTPVPLRFVRAY